MLKKNADLTLSDMEKITIGCVVGLSCLGLVAAAAINIYTSVLATIGIVAGFTGISIFTINRIGKLADRVK